MGAPHLSGRIREVAMAFDHSLEAKDLQAIMDKFVDDCEILLLNVKLSGKEGVKKWFNWIYRHVAKLELIPITIMVDNNIFFEEFIVNATFKDGQIGRSNQAEVLVFDNLKIKSLRMYFDRLDFANAITKDVVSRTIVCQLVKKSVSGLM
jgi:ketosteroid isomerase-like protein